MEVIVALVGLSGTLIIALLGLYGAKKYNIGPNQEKLVATLKDLVDAQEDRIKMLEELSKTQEEKVSFLGAEVVRLTNLTLAQMIRIQELELQTKGGGSI